MLSRNAIVACAVAAAISACSKTYGQDAPAEPAATVEPNQPTTPMPMPTADAAPVDAAVVAAPDASANASKVFSDPVGDATGAGLDLGDTKVSIDDSGVLTVRVETPAADRNAIAATDDVQIFLDVDRDTSTGTTPTGFETRLVLFGGAPHPFALERWENGAWVDRTPVSYMASFDRGIDIHVLGADAGIGPSGAFDFAIVSIDGNSGQISDLAPAGALTQRFTYMR